jgi:hypothetical protein
MDQLSSVINELVYTCRLIWIQMRLNWHSFSFWGLRLGKCVESIPWVCHVLTQDLRKGSSPLAVSNLWVACPVISTSFSGTMMQPPLNGSHLLLLYAWLQLGCFDIKTRMVARRQNKDVVFMGTCVSIAECSATYQLKQPTGTLETQLNETVCLLPFLES